MDFRAWIEQKCQLARSERRVAKRLGVSNTTVNRWRHGVQKPSYFQVQHCLACYGESPDGPQEMTLAQRLARLEDDLTICIQALKRHRMTDNPPGPPPKPQEPSRTHS